MSHEISSLEASSLLLGSRYKIDVWGAILEYKIDPPEQFYATGVYHKILDESGVKVKLQNVRSAIGDFSSLGMVTEVEEHNFHRDARVYQRIESPGWKMIAATVETFNLWYPNA